MTDLMHSFQKDKLQVKIFTEEAEMGKAVADFVVQRVKLAIQSNGSISPISCVVPGKRKAQAVSSTLHGAISTDFPTTILRNHPDTTLFLDSAAASSM